ncbi:hypothetical protein CJ026_026620, partial [Ralstonia pickettii]
IGKDRTGVSVAVTLAAAGVDDDAIVGDYALTEQNLPASRARQIRAWLARAHPGSRHLEELYLHSPARAMRHVLAHLHERRGGGDRGDEPHGLAVDEEVEHGLPEGRDAHDQAEHDDHRERHDDPHQVRQHGDAEEPRDVAAFERLSGHLESARGLERTRDDPTVARTRRHRGVPQRRRAAEPGVDRRAVRGDRRARPDRERRDLLEDRALLPRRGPPRRRARREGVGA